MFALVAKYKTIRMVLALVVQKDWELEQMEIKTAFLHRESEELIFMKQPEGYEQKKSKEMVCKLRKSLNGLKQSPRQWNKRFATFI